MARAARMPPAASTRSKLDYLDGQRREHAPAELYPHLVGSGSNRFRQAEIELVTPGERVGAERVNVDRIRAANCGAEVRGIRDLVHGHLDGTGHDAGSREQ